MSVTDPAGTPPGDRIFIEGLEIDCIIGIHGWEREVRQKVSIDLDIETDTGPPSRSDRIEDAVDYKALCKGVAALVRESSYHLLEALAGAIASFCLDRFPVSVVRVRLSKPGALRGARNVGVEIVRRQRRR